MPVFVDSEKFEAAHQLFEQHLLSQSNGVPFTSFQHPFLQQSEIDYKREVSKKAKEALCLDRWSQWINEKGKILQATREACKLSENLLDHKYGWKNSSESSLYTVEKSDEIRGLESQLANFFLGGSSKTTEFCFRFDALANYLRMNRLGCPWAFLSYLAFLLNPQTYFTVRPSYFDALFHFYGINESISGFVSWERYSLLLELVEDFLKAKLTKYGQADAIEIHSYMWVVSYLIKADETSETDDDSFN
jgi:hypothetical protein